MANEKESLVPQDIHQARSMLGKYLCHVRHSDEGVGFAFCLGDSPTAKNGPLALCKIEEVDRQIQLKLYCNGIWCDEEEVLYEAK